MARANKISQYLISNMDGSISAVSEWDKDINSITRIGPGLYEILPSLSAQDVNIKYTEDIYPDVGISMPFNDEQGRLLFSIMNLISGEIIEPVCIGLPIGFSLSLIGKDK